MSENGRSDRPARRSGDRRDGRGPSRDGRGPRREGDGRRDDRGSRGEGGFTRDDRGPRREGGFKRDDRRDDRGPRREGGFKRDDRRDDRGPRREGGFKRDDRRDDRGPRREGGFSRDDRRDDRRPMRDREEDYVPRPGTGAAADEPPTPTDFDPAELIMPVKAELKSLPKELADIVGAHISAAGDLIDEDPEMAYKHALAAKRRAGRLPIVREATAETAYAAGHYEIALREFRALRRMQGGDEYLPAMADCERALGRHRDALDLLGELSPKTKDIGLRIECLIVEAGIRDDLGQRAEALRLLKNAIGRKIGPRHAQARLRYAYADLLEQSGHPAEARQWFEAAEKLDATGALDTTDRVAAIDGIVLPDDFVLEDPEDSEELEDEETPETDEESN